MSNINAKVRKIAVTTLVVFNIALAGAVAGAYTMHSYDTGNAKATQHAAQELLKSVPTAQAANSPK